MKINLQMNTLLHIKVKVRNQMCVAGGFSQYTTAYSQPHGSLDIKIAILETKSRSVCTHYIYNCLLTELLTCVTCSYTYMHTYFYIDQPKRH